MSTPVRTVTITADDLGLDPGVNAAIADLARAGTLHAASLLIAAPHAGAALSAPLPNAVGLHVDLPKGLHTGTSEQIRIEITRQFQQMAADGHRPTHLDLHTVALYGAGPGARRGGVLAEALAVAAAHRVPLRLPRILPAGIPHVDQPGHQQLLAAADAAGVPLPQTILSDFRPPHQVTSYGDLHQHYRTLVRALPAGRSEIVLHPARPLATDGAWRGATDPARRKRVWEYRLLASGDLHRVLAAAGVGTTAVPTPAAC